MAKTPKTERRQHPRVEQKLPVKIAANGYDFSTTTKNISCVGAYCRVAKYIPPFTKITVRLRLPVRTENRQNNYAVQCQGVVVRTEDEITGGFNIAIFFNRIRDEERQKISRYINQFSPAYQITA
ncbi:MAG: PilZ domain-containing protein [Candidatus Omnitrophica bacterium]|nr:PilZ domain-containing protein [Candidatus Omnitrophota bacterium]